MKQYSAWPGGLRVSAVAVSNDWPDAMYMSVVALSSAWLAGLCSSAVAVCSAWLAGLHTSGIALPGEHCISAVAVCSAWPANLKGIKVAIYSHTAKPYGNSCLVSPCIMHFIGIINVCLYPCSKFLAVTLLLH